MPYLFFIWLMLACAEESEDEQISTEPSTELTEMPEIINIDDIEEETTTLDSNETLLRNEGYVVEFSFSKLITFSSSTEEIPKNARRPQTTSTEEKDDIWMNKAIRDIAYYIRSYKFKEYDRRYNLKPPDVLGQYFSAFPKPPLRSLHWEVGKYCDVSFQQCVKYLAGKTKHVLLRREDDTIYIIKDMNWTLIDNKEEIESIDVNCKNLSGIAFLDATPFEGPLERFQWRTTASYYMCWYTMKEEPALMHFNETCDNLADCLSAFGLSNDDARANDENPFACALYSFCPDPCCPIRYINDLTVCFSSPINPCFSENNNDPFNQQCIVKRHENEDFRDIILNRFNVTCHCQRPGHIWESRYGMCVDIDECVLGNHTCERGSEICVNTRGAFTCACNWGFIWNESTAQCDPSEALSVLKKEKEYKKQMQKKTEVTLSLFKLIGNWFSRAGSNILERSVILFSVVLLS